MDNQFTEGSYTAHVGAFSRYGYADQSTTAKHRTPNAKERRLIEEIKNELAEGKRCQVYAVYTQKRDVTARLEQILAREGIRTAVLRRNVPTDKREAWYAKKVKEGIQVVIAHPKLVETGLDLLDFPTILFYESDYSLHTLRQAARRRMLREIVGLLSLGHSVAGGLTADHLRIAELLAIPAAAAIQNARLYERAEIYGEELEKRLTDLRIAQNALAIVGKTGAHLHLDSFFPVEEGIEIERSTLSTSDRSCFP